MSNRESYPASQSPLTGDISGPAGARTVTVTGIQTFPVNPTVEDQDYLIFDGNVNEWVPKPPGNVSITVDAVDVSDDFYFSCDYVDLVSLVDWTLGFDFIVFLDGTGVF